MMKLILILVFASLTTFIDAQCVDLVHHYYQCKNLKMVDKTTLKNGINFIYDSFYSYNEIYIPDPSIPNNSFNDSFYKSLKLDEKNFDWAMNIFRDIYIETDNCTSQFCTCMNKTLSLYKNFKPFFRNEKIFHSMKQIIGSYIRKYNSSLLSYNEITKKIKNKLYNKLPSLAKFCINYNYHPSRLNYYKSETKVDSSADLNESRETSCVLEFLVDLKTIKIKSNFTIKEFGDFLVCHLLRGIRQYKDSIEQQRYYILVNYVITMSSDLKVDFKNFSENITIYLDTIITKIKNYKPKINAIEAVISYHEVGAFSRKNDEKSESLLSIVCLNSSTLIFVCNWRFNGFYGYQMVSANLKFMSGVNSYSSNITLNTKLYSYVEK